MDFLTEFAGRWLTIWNGLSALQQILVGAVGALLGYLLLRTLVRSIAGIAMGLLIFIVAFVALRLVMPDTFCAVRWPAPIASMCAR
jgi:uncharacterized membrane protein YkgB